ncbi:MAG: DUF6263 family protein [Ignavibacteriaceae bacterium]
MMKNYVVLVLFLALAIIGCDNKETSPEGEDKNYSLEEDTTSLKTEGLSSDAVKDVVLEYKLKKGDKFTYRVSAYSSEEATVKGPQIMSQTISEERTYIIETEIKEVESDKSLDVSFLIKSIRVEALIDGNKVSYLSGSKIDSADIKKFAEYEGLYKNSFGARLTSSGEILELYKLDKIVNKMLEITGLKDSVTAEQKSQIKEQLDMGSLRLIVSQIFRKLTSDKVSVNSEWSAPQPTVDIQLLKLDNTYKFKINAFEKFDDDILAVIDAGVESKFTINPDAKKAGFDVKQPKFIAHGKVYFNTTKNLIQKSVSQIDFDFMVSGPVPTQTGTIQASRYQKKSSRNTVELLD